MFKFLNCSKNYVKEFDDGIKKHFQRPKEFLDSENFVDIDKFCLTSSKGIQLKEYINDTK